jgi:hypothetical protein
LNKCDDPDIRRISAGFELDLEILAKGFLLLEFSNLYELLRQHTSLPWKSACNKSAGAVQPELSQFRHQGHALPLPYQRALS